MSGGIRRGRLARPGQRAALEAAPLHLARLAMAWKRAEGPQSRADPTKP